MTKSSAVRVGVTGAGGMLGKEIVRAAAERGIELVAWGRAELDVTDREAVRRAIGEARPDVVVHAAAWTDVDGCESDPARAFRVNGRGTAQVAEACEGTGSRLVMVSTDYVFSGNKKGPYVEADEPGPLSIYGWSKLLGEEAVRRLGERGTIVRTAWVYADHGRNFLRTMLRLGREKGEVSVVDDQIGSPTFAADLAGALLELAVSGGAGVYHVTNTGAVSWHAFARSIFEGVGLEVTLKAVRSTDFPRPAARPANSVLADSRFGKEGRPSMPGWEDALERCLARMAAAPSPDSSRRPGPIPDSRSVT